MIVVDAGAWALALLSSDPRGEAARGALSSDQSWTMPPHGPVETLRTILRFEQAGLVSPEIASAAAGEVAHADVSIIPPQPWLLETIWKRRHNIGPYDAGYVAIAERFRCPLVTLDKRLARACQSLGITATIPQQ